MDSDENICMTFYTDVESASPYKLYYGLKELATTSDKNDDVLIKKFEGINAISDGYILHLSEEEKNFRFNYINKKIENAISLLKKYQSQLNEHLALKSYIIQSTDCIFLYWTRDLIPVFFSYMIENPVIIFNFKFLLVFYI